MGTLAKAIHDDFKYFLTIVDDATKSTWVYLMKSKSETRPLLISFYKVIHTHFQTNIKVFRTDNAQEFFHRFLCSTWDCLSTFLCCYSITKFNNEKKASTYPK